MRTQLKTCLFSLVLAVFLSLLFLVPVKVSAQADGWKGTAEEIETKISAELPKMKKTIIFDFEGTVSGWSAQNMGKTNGRIQNMTAEAIDKTSIPKEMWKGHGNSVMRLDMAMKTSKWDQAMLQTELFDADWSEVRAVSFDFFVPEGAPETLNSTPFFMSEQWTRWAQYSENIPLQVGQWTTVTVVIPAIKNVNLSKLTTLGTFIWGQINANWNGVIYLDNITVLSPKPLYVKPVLSQLLSKKTLPATINIDASQYGGVISPYLLSVNTGGNINDPSENKLLKDMGPGGFYRTWAIPLSDTSLAKGKYNWTSLDLYINNIYKAGFEPLFVFGQCPVWLAPKDDKGLPRTVGPPTDPQAWADMAADIVKHYNIDLKRNIKYWEIWNEPDLDMFWGGNEEQLAQLTALASAAMKKVDPTIKIVGGSWANSWAPGGSRLKNLLSKKPQIDYIAFHNYLVGNSLVPEKIIINKLPVACEGPVNKARVNIKKVSEELGLGDMYKNLDVMQTEANIWATYTFGPRIDTMLFPVYWATSIYHWAHRNLMATVYFEFGSWVWGMIFKQPRPIYYLFPLLRDKAKFNNAKWCKVEGEMNDLKVLALKQDNYFNLVVINNSTTNIKYKTTFNIKNVKGVSSFKVYQMSDSEKGGYKQGDKPIATIPFKDSLTYEFPPFTITVLQGEIAKGAPQITMVKYEEPIGPAALGFNPSGQYSFAGTKAQFMKKTGAVVVDGDLKEFAGCPPIYVTNIKNLTGGEAKNWGGRKDSSGTVRMMWDDRNIYFAIDVADDVPMINFQDKGANMWNGDNIELYLGTHHVTFSRDEKGDYDYQILMCPQSPFKGGKPALYSEPGSGGGTRDKELIKSEIASKKTATGYTIEARISLDNFYEMSAGLKQGQLLRFDIGIDDADVKDRKTQIMWNANDGTVWNNPDTWGLAEMK